MNEVIVTTINGVGVAQAKNNLASFSLSLRTKGESLTAAKSQLEEKVSEVLGTLSSKNMKLEGEIVTARQNFKLEHREGTERYAAGFQSVATICWTCAVDETLDDVYQSCLKFDSNMPRPSFSHKDRDALQVEALAKAKDHVRVTLEKECSLLGVSPKDLKILNWTIGYNGAINTASYNTNAVIGSAVNGNYYMSNTAMGVTGVTGPQGPQGGAGYQSVQKVGSIYQELLDYVPLDPGNVVVSVPVQVNYVWNE